MKSSYTPPIFDIIAPDDEFCRSPLTLLNTSEAYSNDFSIWEDNLDEQLISKNPSTLTRRGILLQVDSRIGVVAFCFVYLEQTEIFMQSLEKGEVILYTEIINEVIL